MKKGLQSKLDNTLILMQRREFLRSGILLTLPVVLGNIPLKFANAAAFTLPTHGTAYANVKNFGAYGDGVHDDTAAIQKAINSMPSTGGTVFVPAGRYMINAVTTLQLKSNMLFQMDPSAILVAKPNSQERYYVLSVSGVSNVEVSGGRIIGERDQHTGTTGEWGYGIQVGSANRVYIHDVHISKCWGDGICVGGSSDVEIRRVVCTQNRRQGLSITKVNNVRVFDSEFSYTNGTSPECGIDIEPDLPGYANYVLIDNCVLKGNAKFGLNIFKQAQHITVRNCTIEENVSLGISAAGCSDITFTGNLIQNNGATGIRLNNNVMDFVSSSNIFFNNYRRLGDKDRTDFYYTGYKSALSRDWYFLNGLSYQLANGLVIGKNLYK